MQNCPQTEGQSVLEHGVSVNRYFHDLLKDKPTFDWHFPDWFAQYREKLTGLCYPIKTIDSYTVYHDCGKPYCITQNESGTHFPDHATVSKNVYFQLTQDQIVSNLIGWDMGLHTASSIEIKNYLESVWSANDAATLLLVALAEIHSNAALFGGLSSTSFKIKAKALARRGKQVCKYLFETEGR